MAKTDVLPAELVIRVNGRDIPETLRDRIRDVEIEQRLYGAATFRIRIDLGDDAATVGDEYALHVARLFADGAAVDIVHRESRRDTRLIVGEVTSIALDLNTDRAGTTAFAIVQGHDLSQRRLCTTARARTFQDVRYSDIVAEIASEAGLQAKVQTTPGTFEHVLQPAITDGAFVVELARRVGYVAYIEERSLVFGKPGGREDIELKWGESLVQFQPVLDTSSQVARVKVAKRGVAGQGAASPGIPSLQPDATVHVRGLGDALEIDEAVTGVVHRFAIGEGYATRFTIGDPLRNRPAAEGWAEIDAPAATHAGFDPSRPRTGIVTDNRDPERLGRVRVSFPELTAAGSSAWARVVATQAGPDRGFRFLPETGDEVLVTFEAGDLSRPCVIGGLWSDENPPPESSDGDQADVSLLRTRSGHEIVFDDTDGAERIEIRDTEGNCIVLDADSGEIRIEAEDNVRLVAGRRLVLEGEEVEIRATARDVRIEAATDLVARAAVKAKLEGSTLDLEGDGLAVLRAGVVRIN